MQAIQQKLQDVAYGTRERNKLDAYLVGTPEAPAPALIYFHGGGYLGGDKSEVLVRSTLFQECIEAGISVITCNYTFISTDPFPAPMNDGTRALQFVRSKSREWGIDPQRIASAGSSAGGHIALWNALKGDLANAGSADPVERESSAVRAFVGFGTQVSKDQRFYEDIYDGPHIQPNLALFYGVPSDNQLYDEDTLKRAEAASAINFMSADAPPAFMIYDIELDTETLKIPADAPVGEVIHHPMHGYILKQKYDEYGIPFVLRHAGDPVKPGEIVNFLKEHLSM